MLRRGEWTASVFLVAGVFCAACSSASTETSGARSTGTGTSAGTGSSTSSSGPSGAGGATGSIGTIDIGDAGPSGTGGAIADDAACAASSVVADRVTVTEEVRHEVVTTKPVALYLMQDRSGSMLQSTGIPFFSPSKWQQTVDAIQAFVADPKSSGFDVALGFFPSETGLCAGDNYDQPVVAMGRLPSAPQAQAINAALTAHAPGSGNAAGGTPIEGGLRGAVNFCLVFQANHPDEKCAVVLITDGAPTECAKDTVTLSAVASEAYGRAQVKTFTIGMNGADPALLNSVAASGQTDCAPTTADNYCNVSKSTTAFGEALNRIRETITETVTETVSQTVTKPLECEFKLPPAPSSQVLALDRVNVRFAHDGRTDTILKVDGPMACATQGDRGWYYDDDRAPTKIQVCPGTCMDIKAAGGDGGNAPRVDILLGCKTETAIPR